MAPILAAIASMFVDQGLGLLAGAVKGTGEMAVEFIERETGIDIKDIADSKTDSHLTTEHIKALKELESSKVLDLAKIVAGADADKAPGIVMAGIADEIPELILFGMGMAMILCFAIVEILKTGKPVVAANLASAWMGAFAMYVKGK